MVLWGEEWADNSTMTAVQADQNYDALYESHGDLKKRAGPLATKVL